MVGWILDVTRGPLHYTFLQKELEHPQSLISAEVREAIPYTDAEVLLRPPAKLHRCNQNVEIRSARITIYLLFFPRNFL